MIATYNGVFAKHGLDADITLIGINTNIPPAIVSDSIQIGGPTSTVFLQAVDGGLDLVAIAGASVMDPSRTTIAVVEGRPDDPEPEDFVGKKVGAPGIGAFLHVLFRKWLIDRGVDPKKVNYVEVTFPTQNDALKSGSVDAVLTAEPFVSAHRRSRQLAASPRITPWISSALDPIIEYVTTRDWRRKKSRGGKAFREAIAEAAAIVNADPQEAESEASLSSPRCRSTSSRKTPPASPSRS